MRYRVRCSRLRWPRGRQSTSVSILFCDSSPQPHSRLEVIAIGKTNRTLRIVLIYGDSNRAAPRQCCAFYLTRQSKLLFKKIFISAMTRSMFKKLVPAIRWLAAARSSKATRRLGHVKTNLRCQVRRKAKVSFADDFISLEVYLLIGHQNLAQDDTANRL